MPEYILRPTQYSYKTGYQYLDANYPTENAFDGNINTYWATNNASSSLDYYYSRAFYGFNFAEIPNNETVTDIKCVITYSQKDKGSSIYYQVLHPTKSISYKYNYDYVLSPPDHVTLKSSAASTIESKTTESFTGMVSYLNENKAKIISGEMNCAVNFECHCAETKVYDIYLLITTAITGSLIYLGDANITSTYLGNTPVRIFLGDKALL